MLKCSDIRAVFGHIEDRFGIGGLSESEKCVFLEDHDQKNKHIPSSDKRYLIAFPHQRNVSTDFVSRDQGSD